MKCFNINVCIYSTCASSSVLFCFIPPFCNVDIDVCIYSTCAFLILFVYCQVDFNVDNVQC